MVKKYLFGSLAAIATLGFMTSCGNEDAFDGSQDINVAKYEMAFKAIYGNPAPTQDWGFGTSTRGTRAIPSPFDFPSDAAASNFLESVPGTVDKLTENAASINAYIDETWQQGLNIWGADIDGKKTGGTLYITGNCDFSSNSFYFAGGTIYLVKGATLTLGSGSCGNLQGGTTIYIADGAQIISQGEFVLNKGMYVYNHGTITAPSLSLNENEWGKPAFNTLYNGSTGKINLTGRLAGTKDKAAIVNDGEIECGSFNTAGGSHIQNNGVMTVNGTTTINSNDNTWINNNKYTTTDFIYTAGSNNVINNCMLTVTNLFKINLGDSDTNGFRMDSDCGVLTKDFELAGPARIFMGSNSVFKVTGEAKMNIKKAGYGIYGPETGDYAVFQADKITCNDADQRFNVTYLNNLYVVANTHFAFGYDNLAENLWADHVYTEGDGPFYHTVGGAVVYTGGDKPGITIPETNCNPGFGGGDEFTPVIRVMAEDLTVTATGSNSDFDFNDIVFDVQWTSTGAKVRINAAGGTLPLTIGGEVGGAGTEVHAAFKTANPNKNITTKTMMNTYSGYKSAYNRPIITLTGNFVNSETGKKDANLIKLFVNKGTEEAPKWIELTAVKGKVASKIAVEPKVDWCDERQPIDERYDKFPSWVRGEVEVFY